MNKKKIKKLTLNAETLRILSDPQLREAAGAVTVYTQCYAECTATYGCSGCNPCR